MLTLWSARAVESFALDAFNTGDYYKAVEEKVTSETVTKVLYPNDEPEAGKQLRLEQQYFFVSCSLQHVLHIMDDLADASVHRPAGAIRRPAQRHPPVDRRRRADAAAGRRAQARLGRGLGRSPARRSATPTTPCCPRRWRRGRWRCSASRCRGTSRSSTRSTAASWTRCGRTSPATTTGCAHVADRRGRRQDRAHGAPRHRRQPRDQRRRRAALRAAQGRVCSRTSTSCGRSGSPTRPTASRRGASWRWPTRACASCSTDTIGDGWLTDLDRLRGLEALRRRCRVPQQVARRQARQQGAARRLRRTRRPASSSNPDSLFDVQVKRIHEYKRQHLNVLHIVTLVPPAEAEPRPARSRRGPSSSAARRRRATSWPSESSS